MRKSLLTIAIVLGILVAVAAVLAGTPLGWNLAAGLIERSVERSTSLDLEIGALRGNLLSSVTMTDLSLSVPDGPTLLEIDRVTADYSLLALLRRRVVVHGVRVVGASVLIEIGDEGRVVGWSDVAGGTAGDAGRGDPFEYDILFSLDRSSVTVRDAISGLVVDGLDVSASGEISGGGFEATLAGSLEVATPALSEPATGRISARAAWEGDSVSVGPVLAHSRGFELNAFGEVELPPASAPGGTGVPAVGPVIRLDVKSSIELAEVARLIGPDSPALAAIDGAVTVHAKVDGPVDSLVYSASVTADGVALGDVGASAIEIEIAGDRDAVEVTRFGAVLFGGTLAGSARVDLAAARLDSTMIPFSVAARAEDVRLSRLLDSAPGGASPNSPDVSGVLRASLEASGGPGGIAGLLGSFDAGVAGLSVGERELGGLGLSGTLADGRLSVQGACCGVDFDATAALDDGGLGDAAFSLELSDLSALGALLGAPELAGTGVASGSLTGLPGRPALEVDADLPDLRYADVLIGPAAVHAEGGAEGFEAAWTAFGAALTGQGSFEAGGSYEAAIQMDGFDLAAVVPDSIRELMALGGAVSARLEVAGDSTNVRLVEGTVSALSLEARGHGASLESPFRFRVSPDSLSVTWMSLQSDFGWISLMGDIGAAESGRISARFHDLDLAAIADLAPAGLNAPLEGKLDGSADLTGSLDRPRFAADVSIGSFSMAGLAFDHVTIEAEGDTSDIVFDVSATSPTSGSITIYGAVPVIRDSVTFWAPDPGREFGASLVCNEFTVDAGAFLLPSVRGVRMLYANGSVLLSGRADSLGSLRGRGRFDGLSATFDLVRFAAADTLEFEIGDGGVELTNALIGVTRRRAFGDEVGGVIELAGAVRRDRALDLALSVRGVEVGRILRTLAPRSKVVVSGEMDARATITGTVTVPVIEFACEMSAPVIYDLVFDWAAARGRMEGGTLSLDMAELGAGARAVSASGVVALPERARSGGSRSGPEAPELDIRIVAAGFDLGRVRPRRSDIERLKGVVDADLHVLGSAAAPHIEGTIAVKDGELQGFGLAEPVRSITLEITAGDGTIALTKGRTQLGSGVIDAVGFVTIVPNEEPTFWFQTKLRSPEIAVDGSFDARLGGTVVWAGSAGRSRLSGTVSVEEARVTHDVGVLDAMRRRPIRVIVNRPNDPMANVELDLDIDIEDRIEVRNNLADVDLRGGFHLGETFYAVEISGGLYAEGGSFRYLENEFSLEALSFAFVDPRRRDPYVDLLGTASVTDRAGESYVVTVRFQGFLYDAVPQLSSSPPLSEPDIVALLTFGDTVGWLVSGDGTTGSSGDRFVGLARRAFVSSVFGVAESTLERLLNLDTVVVDGEAVLAGDLAGTDVTLGKEFGDRLRVNYTTAVGRFSDQRVEVSFRLTRRLSLETRADPEGNHAIDLRLRLPFR